MLLGWVFRRELQIDFYKEAVDTLYRRRSNDSRPPGIPKDWPLPDGIMSMNLLHSRISL